MNTAIIVKKLGGSSVSSPDKIKAIAKQIATDYFDKKNILLVVSAMGNTTNDLSHLAYQIASVPNRRELDMLLSTGERVACALMSMALNDLGVPAISFTGSQAGILTDNTHNNARIQDVKPIRVQEEFYKNKVVVLAGFQGVDPTSKDITTLGRGGTDTTAIALSHFFKAEKCEMLKDVDGVFSADPKIVKKAKQIASMSYDHLIEMTYWGAKVLHYRAVELAKRLEVPIYIGLAHGKGSGTIIQGDNKMFESIKFLSINSHQQVFKIEFKKMSLDESLETFHSFLKQHKLSWPQILANDYDSNKSQIYMSGSQETLTAIKNLSTDTKDFKIVSSDLSSVAATCEGNVGSNLLEIFSKQLRKNKITAEKTIVTAL
ncbi:MAG: aspartate kinase, partial [Bdellovibrionales bacterium]|nr:aspartate kinase [Bdellovibrionales bacterium]